MDSEDLEKYITELQSMSTSELRELNERSRIEKEELIAEYKALKKENKRLTKRYSKVDKEVIENNKTRDKMMKKIAKIKENTDKMRKNIHDFNEEIVGLPGKFQKSREKAKEVKKMFEEKCLDIRASRGEFKTQSNKLRAEIEEAQIELTHKKDSLAANQQVLESKIACLAKDEEECTKKSKELQLLTEKNHKTLLKELEQKEEDMKLEFSDLNAKLAESYKVIDNLDAEKASLTVETDKLSLELAVEEKCNQKLETELKNEEENLEQLAFEMVADEINDIHCVNLELAKILRDDMLKNEENLKEIEFLEGEKAEIERNNQDFDILKEQKIEQLKKLKADISASIEEKMSLVMKTNDHKNFMTNKEQNVKLLKKKIAEKEKALKKQAEAIKATQLTVTKGTQLTSKTTQSTNSKPKTSKSARPKSNKSKEPPVTKSKKSTPSPVEPMSISNEEQSDNNIFTSSSSGGSDLSFSMSSSFAGSKPDIMKIIANLSGNTFFGNGNKYDKP